MSALGTRYLGLELVHPIIASASPSTATFDGMRRLEDAGAAAVVMASLCKDEVQREDTAYALLTESLTGCHQEAGSYFPELAEYRHGFSGHLQTLRRAAESLRIPVIASLSGVDDEHWVDFALQLEQAGAAAIELDPCFVPGFSMSGSDIENRYLEIVREVKSRVGIPVSIKLPPFFTSLGNFVKRLEQGGVDGIVLFKSLFQPDVDLEKLSFSGESTLSSPDDTRLSLTWIALLSRHLNMSVAAGMSVDSYIEVVKFLLAGADVVMTPPALSSFRSGRMADLVIGLEQWLDGNSYGSVSEIRGILGARHAKLSDLVSLVPGTLFNHAHPDLPSASQRLES